jgi:hypothetical protein
MTRKTRFFSPLSPFGRFRSVRGDPAAGIGAGRRKWRSATNDRKIGAKPALCKMTKRRVKGFPFSKSGVERFYAPCTKNAQWRGFSARFYAEKAGLFFV